MTEYAGSEMGFMTQGCQETRHPVPVPGKKVHIGVGRGSAAVVIIAGILLAVTALALYPIKSVRALEETSC